MVLQSDQVRSAIEASGAVTLKADVTKDNPDAYALMEELGNTAGSIPFLAVFSPDDPTNPGILRDLFSRKDLIALLEKLHRQ